MKTLITIALALFLSKPGIAQHSAASWNGNTPEGILASIQNASVTRDKAGFHLTATGLSAPIQLLFTDCQALGVSREANQWWILPTATSKSSIDVNHALWVMPVDATSSDNSWHLELHDGTATATTTQAGLAVTVHAQSVRLSRAEARPRSDPFGHRFSIQIAGDSSLERALAAFYWGTMLPSVVERTFAANFPYHDGYVLSTLNVNSYAGSYPAVDHEFQIKGRLAIASDVDLDIVRRMIELQFKLMKDDPEHLYRAPTSVQPDGRREYHVRRNSLDNHQNAAMFPLTGNIEVIEESWRYYQARKDATWLRSNIANLEHAAGWIQSNTDQYGRAWSDVYYEDQVIKDGRVTQAQAFAARAFKLLADMEALLRRNEQAARFRALSKKMSTVLIAPLPEGYWDPKNSRFIDWVDRDGKPHDHLHLLANELPISFGYATPAQVSGVRRLLNANAGEFERFPSFVSAKIADYTKAEIGSGGPYDLCAAGRYWYWDADYRASQNQDDLLLDQLKAVALEASKNSYFMSERYDMDHVYYVDGKDAHGAEKYYEYPNVFAAVLLQKLLGLTIPADADVSIAPHLNSDANVELEIPAYALHFSYTREGFVLKNLSNRRRRFAIDLSSLGSAARHYRLTSKSGNRTVGARTTLVLSASEEAHWTPAP